MPRAYRRSRVLQTARNTITVAATSVAADGDRLAIVCFHPLNGGNPRYVVCRRTRSRWAQITHPALFRLDDARRVSAAQARHRVSVHAYPVKWEPLIKLLDQTPLPAAHNTPDGQPAPGTPLINLATKYIVCYRTSTGPQTTVATGEHIEATLGRRLGRMADAGLAWELGVYDRAGHNVTSGFAAFAAMPATTGRAA